MPLYLPSFDEIMAVAETRGEDSDAPHLWRGLVGAWPLQEPGGVTAFDVSGYGRHGTLTGGPTRAIGTRGRTVNFAGDDDYINVAASPLSGQTLATFSFWGYRADTTHIVVAGNPVGYPYLANFKRFNVAWLSDNKVYWQVENGEGSWPSCALAGIGLHHFAMVFNGSLAGLARIQCFIDGAPRSLGPGGKDPAASIATEQPLTIGRDRTGVSTYRYMTGQIFGVNAYDRCLAPAEIQQLYADPWAMYRLRRRVYAAAVAEEPSGFKPYWARRSSQIIGGGIA